MLYAAPGFLQLHRRSLTAKQLVQAADEGDAQAAQIEMGAVVRGLALFGVVHLELRAVADPALLGSVAHLGPERGPEQFPELHVLHGDRLASELSRFHRFGRGRPNDGNDGLVAIGMGLVPQRHQGFQGLGHLTDHRGTFRHFVTRQDGSHLCRRHGFDSAGDLRNPFQLVQLCTHGLAPFL